MIISPLFVFFLFLVFVLIWLFTNTIDNRKWLTFLISVALTPVVYFYLFYPMLNIFSSYHHQKYFDAEAWNEKPALRYEMSEQILNDSLFLKKNKAEIEALLGKAEWYGWDDSINANSPEKWNYNLGFKPGAFNNLQECLEFEFKNDTVSTVKQYQLEQKFE